ncbi:MAG: hypothetical protein IPN33_17950 [Saprospiraceae bacterium]|nr:hypothetical protein [Saprospiraceae bacterium]
MKQVCLYTPACTLLFILAILNSCSGQNTSRESNNALSDPLSPIAWGDTVKEPGNNIMTVYQDSKNNYWFASWQDGLYKYDGKTILHYTTKSGLPHNRVEDIQEDKWGNIYFNTSGGVCQFDGQKFSPLPIMESIEWKLQPGDLWFKSLQFGGRSIAMMVKSYTVCNSQNQTWRRLDFKTPNLFQSLCYIHHLQRQQRKYLVWHCRRGRLSLQWKII